MDGMKLSYILDISSVTLFNWDKDNELPAEVTTCHHYRCWGQIGLANSKEMFQLSFSEITRNIFMILYRYDNDNIKWVKRRCIDLNGLCRLTINGIEWDLPQRINFCLLLHLMKHTTLWDCHLVGEYVFPVMMGEERWNRHNIDGVWNRSIFAEIW